MFTYCYQSDFTILFDLSGPAGWQNNQQFIEKIKQLSKMKTIAVASDNIIEVTESNIHLCNSLKDSLENLGLVVYEDLETDETAILIVSNNLEHIKYYVEKGFSAVYLLTENCKLDLDLAFMPDEIWDYQHFYNFVDNPNLRMTYPAELIGFPNSYNLRTKVIRFPEKLTIPDTNYTSDIIFTGRYFTLRDNRNYNHPLSRAIIGLKNNFLNHADVTKDRFGKVIDLYLRQDSTVSRIVFVPPRPNKESRFKGVEDFVEANINIEFNLLYSKNDYPSPKDYVGFEAKYYNCVYGNIGCNGEVSGHVLLVDDVFTSGATTAECARVLYETGASKVTVLPLAFTQNLNYNEQSVLPVVFNEDGNEYDIGFRRSDYEVYWRSRKDGGGFEYEDFDVVNESYLAYHGFWSTKKPDAQEFNAGIGLDAIIFDLDNTLVHTDHLEHYRRGNLAINDRNLIEEKHIILHPNLFYELKKWNIKIGIVTRSPRKYAESLLSIMGYPYDCLIASKDTLRSKPAPDPMIKCAKKLKVEENNILCIGDQITDIQAGKNAGMMTLHINDFRDQNDLLDRILSIKDPYLPF